MSSSTNQTTADQKNSAKRPVYIGNSDQNRNVYSNNSSNEIEDVNCCFVRYLCCCILDAKTT